jgi:hypothetical protein
VGNASEIIAIVPRAVGSTFPPITCDATDTASVRREWEVEDAQPGHTNGSISESYAIGLGLGLDCALVTPQLIAYAGTYYVAHDMDFVLQALGKEKLSYMYVVSVPLTSGTTPRPRLKYITADSLMAQFLEAPTLHSFRYSSPTFKTN